MNGKRIWEDFSNYVFSIAQALIKLGVDTNDKINIYSYNRGNGQYLCCYSNDKRIAVAYIILAHLKKLLDSCNSESKIVFIGHNPNDNGDPEKMQ